MAAPWNTGSSADGEGFFCRRQGARLKGAGTAPALPAGIHPPFSFCGGKKRTGRGRSKRKSAFAVRECVGFQESLCPRRRSRGGLEVWDTPCVDFRLRWPGAPGERQRKKEIGASPISHSCAIHAAGFVFPDVHRTFPPRGVLFFWTVHGPFSFRQDRKENGGCIPPAKPAFSAPKRRAPPAGGREWGGNDAGIPAHSISSLMRSSSFKSFSRHTEAAVLGS